MTSPFPAKSVRSQLSRLEPLNNHKSFLFKTGKKLFLGVQDTKLKRNNIQSKFFMNLKIIFNILARYNL
jgi:hypothetical protein